MKAAVYLCSFLSGAAALCYEVTWAKILATTFGSTIGATAAVIAGFLGGMGVGAWVYYRARDRTGDPLFLYALLELGIALTALATTAVLDLMPDAFAAAAVALRGGIGLGLVRFASVSLVVLLPAALMGATFPALCTVLIHSRDTVGRYLGALYGWNTIGAAFGALVAGIVLIERIGLRTTALVAVGLNLAIGIAVFVWHRARGSAASEATPPADDPVISTSLPHGLTGAVLFLSGFATLCYEIIWLRSLGYLFGNSTYALTVLLVTFLLGLGFGGQLLGPLARRRNPERDLAVCQLGIGLFALLAIALLVAVLGDQTSGSLATQLSVFGAARSDPWTQRLLGASLASLGMMLPATLLMGLSFPMASRLFLSDVHHLGERVGRAVLLSNVGSILGSVLAALWILPALGAVRGTQAVALLNLGLGTAVLLRAGPLRWRNLAPLLAVVIPSALLLLRTPGVLTSWPQGSLTEIVFFEEGNLATVHVRANPLAPKRLAMLIDGTIIGVSPGVRERIFSKQLMLAHLPLALDDRIRTALSIGLGSGATHASLLGYPFFSSVDCVEINEGVVRGAALFEYASARSDPRSRIVVDDALHFLRVHRGRYDLIISDGKQSDDFSGNAKLLSQEFYELVLSRLSEDGLFAQWTHLGLVPEVFSAVLRTAVRVFPELEVFFEPPGSVIMVGSRKPITGRPHLTDSAIEDLPARTDFELIHIAGPSALRARWVASRTELKSILGSGPLNTWDHPFVEFAPYKSAAGNESQNMLANIRLLNRAHNSASDVAHQLAPPDAPATRVMSMLRMALVSGWNGDPDSGHRLLMQLRREYPDEPTAAHWEPVFALWARTPSIPGSVSE